MCHLASVFSIKIKPFFFFLLEKKLAQDKANLERKLLEDSNRLEQEKADMANKLAKENELLAQKMHAEQVRELQLLVNAYIYLCMKQNGYFSNDYVFMKN